MDRFNVGKTDGKKAIKADGQQDLSRSWNRGLTENTEIQTSIPHNF